MKQDFVKATSTFFELNFNVELFFGVDNMRSAWTICCGVDVVNSFTAASMITAVIVMV